MRRCGNKPRSDWSQREPIHLRQFACAKLRGGLSCEGIARSSAEHHLSAPERRLSRFAEAHPRQTRQLIRDRRRVTACPRPKFRRCRSCPQLRANLSGKTATAQIKGLAEHGKFCAQRIVSTGDKPPPDGLYEPFLHNLQFTLAQRYLFRSTCAGFSRFSVRWFQLLSRPRRPRERLARWGLRGCSWPARRGPRTTRRPRSPAL